MYTIILKDKNGNFEALNVFEYIASGTVIQWGADDTEVDGLKTWTVL